MSQNNIKSGKRPKNPLIKRVWRDLISDWKRYLMIFLMLVVTIGFVSGMYVANNSMMSTLESLGETFRRENGHFELSAKADENLISALESGKKADVLSVLRERAYTEAEDEVKKAVDEAIVENVTESVKQAFEENIREQVKSAITAEVTSAMEEQFKEAEKSGKPMSEGQKQEMLGSAVKNALDENYDSAVNEALETAYSSEDYQKALSDALDSAYESDDYKKALSDAMEEAEKEIDRELDEKFDEINEKYELDKDSKEVPVKIYELFYKDCDETISSDSGFKGTVRVFSERKEVNLFDILQGRSPENEHEIIIDRMHADNAGIKIGDILYAGKTDFEVVGLVSFVDYTTLYENNTDTMFDALTFDVAMTTEKGFERISSALHANYAFTYNNPPAEVYEEKELSDSFLKILITQAVSSEDEAEIKNFVPAYANHAITFAPDDMGSDKSMGGVLLYILVAVLAFIFAVTAVTTLEKESSVIGTLRASGYTKGEMLRYYMGGPVIVILIASVVGNILGYTVMKNVVVAMYYNSYSLPTYKTIWTPEAFIRTTVIPIILMLVINLAVITHTLKLSPLKFLRHDLKRNKRKKALRLPKWNFFARFRMRVFLQNVPNYIMMFVGITFIMILLSMAVGMPATLKNYQDSIADMMFAKNQIMLTSSKDDDGNIIETDNQNAEKVSACSLERKSDEINEEITVYGIVENSKYVKLSSDYYSKALSDVPQVYVSKSFAEKYNIRKDDLITLSEKYENKEYTFRVYDIHEYSAGIAVFMSDECFRNVFEKDDDYFSGYMSDDSIDDIDEKYIAKQITVEDMLKVANQLDHSMGNYMLYFQYVCVIVAAIILYLLTKIIIEKNERSISMVKILGYNTGEISSLYLVTTCIVVLISEIPAIYLGYFIMTVVWKSMLADLGGYFEFIMPFSGFVREFVLVFIAYLIITIFDFIRINNIPKVLALKNMD